MRIRVALWLWLGLAAVGWSAGVFAQDDDLIRGALEDPNDPVLTELQEEPPEAEGEPAEAETEAAEQEPPEAESATPEAEPVEPWLETATDRLDSDYEESTSEPPPPEVAPAPDAVAVPEDGGVQPAVEAEPADDTALSELERLRSALDAIFEDERYANAHWGVRVETLDGQLLYDRNGAKQTQPASNQKLLVTAAALAELGPGYTYETRLDAIGSWDGSTLQGDLVIVGSGDPSFGAWHPETNHDSGRLLDDWVTILRHAGLKKVTGSVIGDGRRFTGQYYCGQWNLDDLPQWYATGSSGLAIEENAYRCRIRPGRGVGDAAQIEIIPDAGYISVVNDTRTVEAGGETNADIVWRSPQDNTVRIAGTIALGKGAVERRGSVWDSPRYAAYLMTEALGESGVEVAGAPANIAALDGGIVAAMDRATGSDRRTVAVFISQPMRELVKVVNKTSHNFFADQLLRTLGAEYADAGSFEGGAAAVKQWLMRIGIEDAQSIRMVDGSGLSRRNHCQPRQITAVLRYMYGREELRGPYVASLAIGRVDGTLARRMSQVDLNGARVLGKTGYIGDVRTLSGYILEGDDRGVAFSFMCNLYTLPTREVNASQDQACAVIADYLSRLSPAEEPVEESVEESAETVAEHVGAGP